MTTSQYRRHHRQEVYNLEVDCPNGIIDCWDNLNNLQEIANLINTEYFNDFPVVSRAMVNNWVFKPKEFRRQYANRFKIKKLPSPIPLSP